MAKFKIQYSDKTEFVDNVNPDFNGWVSVFGAWTNKETYVQAKVTHTPSGAWWDNDETVWLKNRYISNCSFSDFLEICKKLEEGVEFNKTV